MAKAKGDAPAFEKRHRDAAKLLVRVFVDLANRFEDGEALPDGVKVCRWEAQEPPYSILVKVNSITKFAQFAKSFPVEDADEQQKDNTLTDSGAKKSSPLPTVFTDTIRGLDFHLGLADASKIPSKSGQGTKVFRLIELPKKDSDECIQQLQTALTQYEATLSDMGKRSSNPSGISYKIQSESVPQFVGRSETLKKLHKQLAESHRCVIVGMGGVGKSELARQYAQTYADDYPGGQCLIDVRQGNVIEQILIFAQLSQCHLDKKKTPQGQIDMLWRTWTKGKLLLVFDDVEVWNNIKDALPDIDERFTVLATSRIKDLDISAQDFPLKILTQEASLEMLSSLISPERVNAESNTALEIVNRILGCLPLGIKMVGKYLDITAQKETTLLNVRERLKSIKANWKPGSLGLTGDRHLTYQEEGVEAAFNLTWDALNQGAKKTAKFITFLFYPSLFIDGLIAKAALTTGGQKLGDIDFAPYSLDDWITDLVQFSLLECSPEEKNCYTYHALIAEFFRTKITDTDNEWLTPLQEEGLRCAIKKVPYLRNTSSPDDFARYQRRVGLIEKAIKEPNLIDDDDIYRLFNPFAYLHQRSGRFDEAIKIGEEYIEHSIKRFGDRHPDVATSLNNLATLYESQGRYQEAEPYFQQALDMRKELLSDNHTDVATSLNHLAGVYYYQGRYQDAEPYYQQALDMKKELLGDNHPDVATILNNLALLYVFQGRYQKAEPYYQQALDMRKELLGDNHPDVATTLNMLADLYKYQGRYAEAEPYVQQALDMRKELLGNNHPDVATSLNHLASLYNFQGRYQDAEPYVQQALDMRKELLGDNHPDVATTLNSLAELYRQQARYDAAKPLYEEALTITKQQLGETHPMVASVLNNLGLIYNAHGQYREAESHYERAIEIWKQHLGKTHHFVGAGFHNLAGLYESQARYSEAESSYHQALTLKKQCWGDSTHPDVVLTLKNLANFYRAQGYPEKAEMLLNEHDLDP